MCSRSTSAGAGPPPSGAALQMRGLAPKISLLLQFYTILDAQPAVQPAAHSKCSEMRNSPSPRNKVSHDDSTSISFEKRAYSLVGLFTCPPAFCTNGSSMFKQRYASRKSLAHFSSPT